MPVNYRISAQAKKDLESIWLYTAQYWSLAQADHYFGLLVKEMDQVGRFPLMGKSMQHIREGYWASKVKSHLIFYKITKEKVTIVRVLHERMDLSQHLTK